MIFKCEQDLRYNSMLSLDVAHPGDTRIYCTIGTLQDAIMMLSRALCHNITCYDNRTVLHLLAGISLYVWYTVA